MTTFDIIILGLIVLYGVSGLYRGFLPSVMNMGAFMVSWIVAFVGYPLVASGLAQSEFFQSMRFYIEGAERVGDVELTRISVSQISESQLTQIMDNAKLPPPYDTAIAGNIRNQAFAGQGIDTLGEYFDAKIYNVIVNIIALILLFVVVRVVLTFLVNAISYSVPLPQLRHFDYVMGSGVGLLRGFFSMHIVFAVVPIVLIIFQIDLITDLVNSSSMAGIFYGGSMLLRFVSGVI